MKRAIDPSDLPLLNLILDRDPTLAAAILTRLDAVSRALGPVATTNESPIKAPDLGLSVETRIVDWLRTHPGTHSPGAFREDMGIPEGHKAFTDALAKLLGSGQVKANGQGRSRKYWLP